MGNQHPSSSEKSHLQAENAVDSECNNCWLAAKGVRKRKCNSLICISLVCVCSRLRTFTCVLGPRTLCVRLRLQTPPSITPPFAALQTRVSKSIFGNPSKQSLSRICPFCSFLFGLSVTLPKAWSAIRSPIIAMIWFEIQSEQSE